MKTSGATKNINVRVDARLKDDAEKIFNSLGLPMSTAINIFLKSAVRYKGMPIDLRLEPESTPPRSGTMERIINNAAYLAHLDRSYEQYHNGRLHQHDLIEAEDE